MKGVAKRLGGWLGALVSKGAEASLVLVMVASLVFLCLRLLPGDPARLVLGDEASEAELSKVRVELGLDAPLWLQYARFLRQLPTLSFGESLRYPGQSAGARVREALWPTASLASLAVLIGALVGVTFAVLASGPWLGRGRAWVDRGATLVAAVPLLSFAPLVTYVFAARLRWVPLPGDPDAGVSGLLFAAGLLSLPLAAAVARVGRAALSEVARAQFVSVARAKGGTWVRAWVLHALPASLGPIVTVVASQLGALLGGAVVLERLFERPGLGTLILEAYSARDLPVLEAAVIAAGALFVVVQVVAAGLHAAFDPRVRS